MPVKNSRSLTEAQAFSAMRLFLEKNWQRDRSVDVAQVLSDIDTEIRPDGGTADPAARADWLDCVEQALDGKREAAE